jgi:hypothetical protein
MATIDTRPAVVDIVHYAGDTLTIRLSAPASITDGMAWKAEVRATRDSGTPDAVFTITAPETSGGDAFLELSAADTKALVSGSAMTTVRTMTAPSQLSMIQKYVGVWDVQVSAAGLDPVRTLAHGSLTIELDVTQ